MTEFKHFKDVGEEFQRGMQMLNGTKLRYGPRKGSSAHFDAALDRAGRRLQEHFRGKMAAHGPYWAPLSETTLHERELHGINSEDPLDATGALKEAITYKVTAAHTLEVGVQNDIHFSPTGHIIHMEDLMYLNEVGFVTAGNSRYPDKFVPARPVFSDRDIGFTLSAEAERFARDVFGTQKTEVSWTKA